MGIETFEFGTEDIVRSELTKFIVSKLSKLDTILVHPKKKTVLKYNSLKNCFETEDKNKFDIVISQRVLINILNEPPRVSSKRNFKKI